MRLEESSADTSRTAELEKEVKEKNLLIGKLRHEGIFLRHDPLAHYTDLSFHDTI